MDSDFERREATGADASRSYSLEEAGRLLGISAQTVRRRLDDDRSPLSAAAGGSGPIRVAFASVQSARHNLAQELGMYLEPPTECDHPGVDDLLLENERLRRLVLTLRVSGVQLLENIGDFADPVLPNN
jgi:hypothetical protein